MKRQFVLAGVSCVVCLGLAVLAQAGILRNSAGVD